MTMLREPASTLKIQTAVGLRSNVLGFPALLAQSVALISPTMTAVLIIPLAFSNAGAGTWLAYGFGTVMLLFVVFCLNQFAKRSVERRDRCTPIPAGGSGPPPGCSPAGP